jgi:heme-degrading monooxygenase HmoA
MIVRVWKARATAEKIAAYRAQLLDTVFPTLQSLKGFIDGQLLERPSEEGGIEIVVQTRWTSMEAVRAFAGDAFENAVVAPGARALLITFDDMVTHFEVKAELKP